MQTVTKSIKTPITFEKSNWDEETTEGINIDETQFHDSLSEKIKEINNLKNFQNYDGINEEFTATKGLHSKYKKVKTLTMPADLLKNYKNQLAQDNKNINLKHWSTLPVINTKENCDDFDNQNYFKLLQKNNERIQQEEDYWNLMYGPIFDLQVQQEHFIQTYASLFYATKQLKGPSDEFLKKMQITLPKLTKRTKTLFLDLDETLVACLPLSKAPEHILNSQIGVSIRPYAIHLLQQLSLHYDLYIFTASCNSYANHVCNILDPKGKYLKGILAREHCLQTKHGA